MLNRSHSNSGMQCAVRHSGEHGSALSGFQLRPHIRSTAPPCLSTQSTDGTMSTWQSSSRSIKVQRQSVHVPVLQSSFEPPAVLYEYPYLVISRQYCQSPASPAQSRLLTTFRFPHSNKAAPGCSLQQDCTVKVPSNHHHSSVNACCISIACAADSPAGRFA